MGTGAPPIKARSIIAIPKCILTYPEIIDIFRIFPASHVYQKMKRKPVAFRLAIRRNFGVCLCHFPDRVFDAIEVAETPLISGDVSSYQ